MSATAGDGSDGAGAASDVVVLAHGSPDPRHAAAVEAITERVRRMVAPRRVHTAYLDHHGPSVTDIAAIARGGVLAPLLLTRATHVRLDVPVAAAAMTALGRGPYAVSAALGPDELLFAACEELLAADGVTPDPGTAVVLCLGGSSDGAAIEAVAAAAAQRTGHGWGPWLVAALAGGDALSAVVARCGREPGVSRVVVVAYAVADGVLRDRMAAQADAAGVALVAGTLGDTDGLARLLVRRVDEAAATSPIQ